MVLIKCKCGTNIQLENAYFECKTADIKELTCPNCKLNTSQETLKNIKFTLDSNDRTIYILPDDIIFEAKLNL